MQENPSDPPPSNPTIKRYAPPNQRNRNLGRRKSGDRPERASNHHPIDGDRNMPTAFRHAPTVEYGTVGSSNSFQDSLHSGFISLNGCSRSAASQLLRDRWDAAIQSYNDPSVDLSERPVMYMGSPASAWGAFRLPHEMMSGSQMDFLTLLRRAMQTPTNVVSKT
ncbi:hypothetical protein Droror1_Dr00019750 [Drosera rotundifolia]